MKRIVLSTLLLAGAAYCALFVTPTFAKQGSQIDYAEADTPAEVKEVVKQVFGENSIMVTIARCESTFRQFNEDGSVLQGEADRRDTGVMQINTHYHEKDAIALGFDIRTLKGNLAYAKHHSTLTPFLDPISDPISNLGLGLSTRIRMFRSPSSTNFCWPHRWVLT